MSNRQVINIEGYSPQEILSLPNEQLDAFVFCEEPVVFRAGSSEILGQFQRTSDTLVLELGHIDGGGEGVLPLIAGIAKRYAKREKLPNLEWRVHAINCANPNPKLKRFLELRGFEIKDIPDSGNCYYLCEEVSWDA